MKRVITMVMVCMLVGAVALPALAQEDPAAQALDYVLTVQNDDGGFSNGWTPESDIGTTADLVVAAVLAGEDPEAYFTGDMMNPMSYLGVQVQGRAVQMLGAGAQAKVLMAAVAVGKDTDAFGGTDLIADLLGMQQENDLFGIGAFDHCLAVVALQNAAVELPEGTVEVLLAAQNEDGGWGFVEGEASDTNTSGLCLQALALLDVPGAVDDGFAYLAAIQNEDAGWPYQNPSEWGTDSDVNSTALVVGALIAHGYDLAEWNNPQEWILSMQNESGGFGYQAVMPDDNLVATVAAIPVIEGAALNAWALAAAAE